MRIRSILIFQIVKCLQRLAQEVSNEWTQEQKVAAVSAKEAQAGITRPWAFLWRRPLVEAEQHITVQYDIVRSTEDTILRQQISFRPLAVAEYLYHRDAEHPSRGTAVQEPYEEVQHRRHPR
jgi:hypothetical protein